MDMKFLVKIIALVVLTLVIILTYIGKSYAGGPWNDQYCNIETTTIKTIDNQGKVIDERTEEKVHCEDGVKDFLHGMGIASNCQIFTWDMPYKNTTIKERSIACQRLDGTYEIVPGYHSVE